MIDFVNNSEPDLTAENLNKLQQDIGTVVSPTEPQGNERLKVWMQKGKNLFNKNNVIKGYYLGTTSTGNDEAINASETDFYQNEYLEVKPNTNYTISTATVTTLRVTQYNANKKFVSRSTNSENNSLTITTTDTTKYIRISSKIDIIDSIQLEQGSSATSFEAYIEPKIYVLNNNGVYEEFIKKATEFKIVSTMGSKDFNTFTKNGFYQCNFQNGINAPDTYSTGMLLVFGNYYIAQLYIADLNSKAKVFARMSANQGASWNSWVTLA